MLEQLEKEYIKTLVLLRAKKSKLEKGIKTDKRIILNHLNKFVIDLKN